MLKHRQADLVFHNRNKVTIRTVFGILEDAKGNIWFGSGGGVHRYDGNTITDLKSAAGQQ